jgi:hypothetical protein
MVRALRWLQHNQDRLRGPATLLWLACTMPVVVVIAMTDPYITGMAAATYWAPVILSNVPARRCRQACWLYAVVWAFFAGLALSPSA